MCIRDSFGGLLYQAEVDYLVVHEFAMTAEDIIWRRSKKGLQMSPGEVEALENYLVDSLSRLNAKILA